jgi:SpoIID/LytB domain protein
MHRSHGIRGRALHAAAAALLILSALCGTALPLAAPVSALAETNFTITGRGYGHGIGMSQWGAQGFAKDQGWDYGRILGHYYQQTSVAAATAMTVKVNLDKDAKSRTSWRIRSGSAGRPLIVVDQSSPSSRTTLDAGKPYWITVSGGNVRVHADAEDYKGRPVPGATIKTFTGAAYATTGGSGYLVQILSASGPFTGPGIRWRGNIAFVPSGTSASQAVNYVGMEQYLYGVVPRESPASFEIEALKSQAVAARSYAYTSAFGGKTLFCTVQSQVYNGHSCQADVHENARTNQAVDATRNQVVKYGTEVVRTYFSSSSGGHTANVEDVWVTSDPKPYYKGVQDADGPYPNGTAWAAPIHHTGSTLAAAIRTYDYGNNKVYDYSSPAPATIVSAEVERASSGFVRYAEFRWSDGKSYRMRGTTFQSALSLKSTKFYLGAEYPPPLVTRRYQETDARIAYAGLWRTSSSKALLGGTQAFSDSPGATCTITFTGTGLRWYGNRSPAYGRANVYVDGSYNRTVDLYGAKTLYRQAIWSVGGLSIDQTHTVTVRVLGTRSAPSKGTFVSADAFDVFDGSLLQSPQPVTRTEETDSRIAFAGTWQTGANVALSGGTQSFTESSTARAVVSFVGRGVSWIGSRSPRYGVARVTLDGGVPQTVDLYSALTGYALTLWSKSGLAFGRHTLVIDATGEKNAASEGHFLSVDAVDVTGGSIDGATLPAVRVEDGAPSVAYTGAWKSGTSALLSGRTQHWSSAKGSSAVFRFSGTSVRWIASRAPSYGKAAVLLDGKQVAVIDLYAPHPAYRQVAFGYSGLKNAGHTLVIRAAGTARAGATGTIVSVDAFDVTGVPASPE